MKFYYSKYFTTLSCFILLCFCSYSYHKDITQAEIVAVGTGYELYYNFLHLKKFAIIQPPLFGLSAFCILNTIHNFENDVVVVPSGDYTNMTSFLFAIYTPQYIGNKILSMVDISYFKIIRILNISFLIVILYLLYCQYGSTYISLVALLLTVYTDIIMHSTVEIITVMLILMMFYINKQLLGIIMGLLVVTYGIHGMMLFAITGLSQIIFHDIKHKKMSKGFKHIKTVFLNIIISFIIVWILYDNMHLTSLLELNNLLNISNMPDIKILPFFNIFKQSIFEIMFLNCKKNFSILENIQEFFSIFNILLFIIYIFIFMKQYINVSYNVFKQKYVIYSILLYISVFLYNFSNIQSMQQFFNIISILLVIVISAQIYTLLNNTTNIQI